MRKQHSTYPNRIGRQHNVIRTVPPRTIAPAAGRQRQGRRGNR